MRRLIITKGLPGSGKTTWAKMYQRENPNTVLVNKDDLRGMLHQNVHSKGREAFVLEIRNAIIIRALQEGHDVIVHDTNLHPKHEAAMREIAVLPDLKGKVSIEIQDFTAVPIEQCIKQDLQRFSSVGEKVIREMYHQFLRPRPATIESNPALPDAILCDIDGTLALFGDANPYERDFSKDSLNSPVRDILYQFKDTHKVILLSGRMDKFREVTEDWLTCNGVPFHQLHMRKTDDVRKDYLIKRELYGEHISGKYNVKFVIDDRLQVCRMWHELGLNLFRVGDPDAVF